METLNITIEKMAEQLALSIKADTKEEQEAVTLTLRGLINFNKEIWIQIVDKAGEILSK